MLGIRPKNTEIKGCDISPPVSVPGVARCAPAPLQAAVVPPARAAAGAPRCYSAGSGGNYTSGCACCQFWGEGNLWRGRGELGLLDVARHDVSGGMLGSRHRAPARVLWWHPSECWLACSPCWECHRCQHLPAGHRQPVPPHRLVRNEGGGGGGLLFLWPSVPAPAAGSPRHSWLTGLWLWLSHTICQAGKRRRSRETVPGAGVPPMDFSATWHEP